MPIEDNDLKQEADWAELHTKIKDVLEQFGTEDQLGRADYLIVDDNYGWRRHTISVQKLHMLQPAVVAGLRPLLTAFTDWDIILAVDVPGTEKSWPRMGVTICNHELIDGLQRQYLPVDWQQIAYPESRTGTGWD